MVTKTVASYSSTEVKQAGYLVWSPTPIESVTVQQDKAFVGPPEPAHLLEHRAQREAAKIAGDLHFIHNFREHVATWRSKKTLDVYMREVCRFYNWATYFGHRPFSCIDTAVFNQYVAFLREPIPDNVWVMKNAGAPPRRESPDWRPFKRPAGWKPEGAPQDTGEHEAILSPASIDGALRAMSVFFGYAVKIGYLYASPVAQTKEKRGEQRANQRYEVVSDLLLEDQSKTSEAQAKAPIGKQSKGDNRYLISDATDALLDHALDMVAHHCSQALQRGLDGAKLRQSHEGLRATKAVNAAVSLGLMYYMCMRATEIAKASTYDIRPTDEGFDIQIHGKGAKERTLQLRKPFIRYYNEIRERAEEFAPPQLTKIDRERPYLVDKWSKPRGADSYAWHPLTYANVYDNYTNLSNELAALNTKASRSLKDSSPHWVRHSGATRLLDAGMTIKSLQEFLGHESVTTTETYIHDSKKRMDRELKEIDQ